MASRELTSATKRPHKGLLRHFLRIFPRLGEAHRKTERSVGVELKERLHCASIPLPKPLDQPRLKNIMHASIVSPRYNSLCDKEIYL